ATVRILESVLRFGLLRAFVDVVVDAVAILIVDRAAIDGSRRLLRTLVVGIGHAVPVRVGAGTRLLGTTVRSYARLIGAGVLRVEDAVGVTVGAPVGRQTRLVLAFVDAVRDPIPIRVGPRATLVFTRF